MSEQRETYLLAWNPARFEWADLKSKAKEVIATGSAVDEWSCGSVKHIAEGSRVFLIRLGEDPRGIVGSGVTVGEVYESPHWDPDRASEGKPARRVRVRFDALFETPLVLREELNKQPFRDYRWDTQMSGVRIPREISSALETKWNKRVAAQRKGVNDLIPPPAVERWRARWAEAQTDSEWLERHELRDEKRREVLPEIRDLIDRFLGGKISVSTFRAEFDLKTRNAWDFFGLKGLSGAMFLNKLAKHLPHDELDGELRAVLRVPPDAAAATAQFDQFLQYLNKQFEDGVVNHHDIQPNRSPFFVSACWHVQEPERWPIMFESARDQLQIDGLIDKRAKGSEGYAAFTLTYRALAQALNLSFWELEHLCARLQDLDGIKPDEPIDQGESPAARVWLVSPGRRAALFDEFFEDGIFAIGWDYLGDLSKYADLESVRDAIQQNRGGDVSPIQAALACYQFAHEMQVGDVVFAKRGRSEIVGYGVVTSPYRHEPARQHYTQVRSVKWSKKGEWKPSSLLVTKTLTDISKYPQLVAELRGLLGIVGQPKIEEPIVVEHVAYKLEDMAKEVFLPKERITDAIELLRFKKNLILQGPPGVGKTFVAKRLAYLLLEEKDAERVAQVQFHQSYSYEDFIQGYRPDESGAFSRTDGIFLRFCEAALQDPELPYVLIIDEINRGNLSRIFGELLMLIESDKRSESYAVSLTYSKKNEPRFYVPPNLHIIGTMNTADRSLAVVDYALRRRFAFFDIGPGFKENSFANNLSALGVSAALRDRILRCFDRLNSVIASDPSLGDGFCMGHSYFCHCAEENPGDEWYRRIIRTEIGPLLREYWFDNKQKADEEITRLTNVE